jgi:glutamate dehydrogenase (NADP+)
MSQSITTFIEEVAKKTQEPEFLQAVLEVAETVIPFIEENKNIRTKCFWKEWLNLIESLCFV